MKKITVICLLFSLLSCQEILFEEDISKAQVGLLAPAQNINLPAQEKIIFSWEPVAGAAYYQLQLARANFSNAVQIELDSIVHNPSFTIDSLKANSYEWRVRAMNSAYETGYTTSGFVVE